MEGQRTPGPYGVFADDRNILVSTADGKTKIARMYAANGADLANAHLFAVADEMRSELLAAARVFRQYQAHHQAEADKLATSITKFDDIARLNRIEKAERNQLMAERIEALLAKAAGA